MRRLRSLRAKVLLVVLAVGVVSLAGFWLLIVPFTKQALHQSEAQLADVYATMVARNLGGDTARALVELERVAAQSAITTMKREDADPALAMFDATTTYFLHYALYSLDGRVVARPDKPERVGADRSADPHVAGTLQTQRTFVGPVRVSPGGNLAVTVGTLVRRDGQVVGVLSGSLGLLDRNPELYSDVQSPALPATWIVTLTSADGAVIARSNGALPSGTIVDISTHPLLEAARAGRRGAIEYVRKGTSRIGAARRIDALGWYVLVEVPREEIEGIVAATTQRVSVIGLVAIVSLVLLMLLLVQRFMRRLGTLASALDSYGAGVETPVAAGPPDEIGEALQAFNKMLTDRRAAEVQRDNLIAELQVRNAEMERFTYSVSHDLKTPLITIGSFARLAEEDLAAGKHDRTLHDLRNIQDASGKMSTLLSQLLELARVGRIVNEPSETPLAEIAAEVVAFAKANARANIELVIQPGLPTLMVDRVRISEVLQNLVDNAVRFMGNQPSPRIEIGVRSEASRVVIYVADNGIGVAPAFHQRIFDLFERLDPGSEGTGIGLALVRRIVEAHGGSVWVESDGENRGSTFCFTVGLPK